ncbi:MAG TPA: SurA N-terminal domain-containing protein [Rubrivivax sp.]|nr:SurA N-terminal domain-containing protein [Rubrivivax sp.]
MFDFVRQHTRLALGFMLLLIIPSFIFFGVQGYSSSDGSNTTVAKVDGQSITRTEWESAHRRVLDNMRRQSPGVDPAQLDSPELRRETLEGIVRERVLLAAANEFQLFPSVARMTRLFDSDPQLASLRGPDGRISAELLAMQGMTPAMFDQRLRQDMGVRQVLSGIAGTVPPAAVGASAALDALLQRRAVQVQLFNPATYVAKLNPSEAEIEAFYKANQGQFVAPEQASIEYVLLDLDALARAEKIDEADLRKAYEDTKSRFVSPEERRASHILIKADKDTSADERNKAKARAEALAVEARKNPAGFAELARKNSADGSAAQGGDLDFFGRGAMVKPFEDTAFALKPGEVSGVVETEFGYHVIMVTGQRGGQGKSFEEVRAEVEAALRKSKAQKRWAEMAEQFTNTVYEQSDSLDHVVKKLGLEKKTATVQRRPSQTVTGPLASTRLLDAVFGNEALRNKRNTDAVEVGPNQIVSARVLQHLPERTLPLAEVKDRVRERLVAEQAAAMAKKEGEAKLAALRANPSGSSEALPIVLTVSRGQAQGIPRPLLDAALRADASKLPALEAVDLGPQGFAVLRVMQVLPREVPPGGDEPLREQVAQAWAAAEAEAYIAALKKRYKAEIKPAADSGFDSADSPASAPAR